jgi:AbrB family looped-hinge helix DNA binding protein
LTLPKDLRKRFHLQEGEKVLLIPLEDGIMMKHNLNPLRELRGILRQEIDVQKASRFVAELRKEWRLERV